MAFILTTPCNLFAISRPRPSSLSLSSRGGKPRSLCARLSLRRAPLFMCTQPGEPQEDSVPLTSLKDLNRAPLAPASAVPSPADDEDDNRSETQKEIDRLRAAEKFITIDEGAYECTACSYLYEPKKGIKQSGIAPGTAFEDLSPAFVCPVCRSPKSRFISKKKIIAGFADNQSYGFGSNTMTGGQKSALIFGGLVVCFLLLLSGYALN